LIDVDTRSFERFAEALKQMPDELKQKFNEALGEAGRQIITRARAYAPVRTGALRASIHETVTHELILIVGAYIHYAVFQEFGTRYIKPRLFMTRAVQEVLPMLASSLGEAVNQAWNSLTRLHG